MLERIFGVSLSLQALETGAAEAGQDVTIFDEQPAEPTTSPPVETILVLQADGRGVPMVQPPTQASSVRLGKWQKRTKKKEYGPSPPSPHTRAALGGGGCPAAGPWPPGAGAPPTTRRQGAAATWEGKARPRGAGTAGGPARTTHPATCRAHWWRRGAAPTGSGPRSGVYLDPGHHSCHGVAVDTDNAPLGRSIRSARHARTWRRCWPASLSRHHGLEAEGKDPMCTVTPRQAVRRTVATTGELDAMRYDAYLGVWPNGCGGRSDVQPPGVS